MQRVVCAYSPRLILYCQCFGFHCTPIPVLSPFRQILLSLFMSLPLMRRGGGDPRGIPAWADVKCVEEPKHRRNRTKLSNSCGLLSQTIYIVFGALGLCFYNLFWSEGQDCVATMTRVFRLPAMLSQFPNVCRPPVSIQEHDEVPATCSLVTRMYLFTFTESRLDITYLFCLHWNTINTIVVNTDLLLYCIPLNWCPCGWPQWHTLVSDEVWLWIVRGWWLV